MWDLDCADLGINCQHELFLGVLPTRLGSLGLFAAWTTAAPKIEHQSSVDQCKINQKNVRLITNLVSCTGERLLLPLLFHPFKCDHLNVG